MKIPKPSLILVSITILTVIAVIILINLQPVMSYGTIKKKGNAFISKTQAINCEAFNKDLIIINPGQASQHLDEEIGIKGYKLFNYLITQSFNESYIPKNECFTVHDNDVRLESTNKTVNPNTQATLEFTINNLEDNRLFYEVRLVSDCTIESETFTNYINPLETQTVQFKVTCSEGTHESALETVFVDELTNQHTDSKEFLITSV